MHPQHLPLLHTPSAPSVHPDGSRALISVSRPDFAADTYVGQLWTVPLNGGEPRRFTRGFRDSAPAFSPDGRLIAFLRAEPGGYPQLAIVPADGGEPLVITDAKLGVREFSFSPDSARLAFIAAVPQEGRYGTVDGVAPCQEDPRRITSLQFRMDGTGYVADQRCHLFVVDVPDPYGEPPVKPVGRAAKDAGEFRAVPPARQVSSGDFDHHAPAWDGDALIVVAARHDGRDHQLREDLYRFGPEDGEPRRLTDPAVPVSANGSPVVVGEDVYFVGSVCGADGLEFFGHNPGIYVVGRAGGAPRRLTEAESVHVAGDLVADGDGVLAVDLVHGRGVAFRMDAAGTQRRWNVPGSVLSVGSGGGARVAVLADADTPGEVVRLGSEPIDPEALVDPQRLVDPQHQRLVEPVETPARLTNFAAALQQASPVLVPVEHTATAPDGYPVHGWVVRPSGEGPHPVLLLIHGGPFAAFSPAFFDEAQVYAAAGYAVLMCNPRGSASYGQAHAGAIAGAFGDRDAADVLAFLDHALATVSGLDAGRVGVMGGSYGGYLTAWLIAHEQRFGAAVVERGYLDPRSFVGASDIGWYFPAACHGDAVAMDAQSPLLLVDRVRTPTLVIHSENDLRCPLATAQRYYTELKLQGVEAGLLVFPGEGHELSRSGTPHHRKARFEHILDWWGRHLPV